MKLCTGRTARREKRDIALPFHDYGTKRGEGSSSRPGCSLPPGKPRYRLLRRLGGSQGRSGQVRKIWPPPGFYSRTVQPVASRYTDYATRPVWRIVSLVKKIGVFQKVGQEIKIATKLHYMGNNRENCKSGKKKKSGQIKL